MSNTDQSIYPDEPASPMDESGLLGEPRSPDNSGLVGTPTSPDNSGLAGSGDIDAATATTPGYGAGQTSDSTGLAGATGAYGSDMGPGGGIGQNSAELPDQQLLQPGYNPQVGDAGQLQDIERGGPNPTGYSGAPDQPGILNQPGARDQIMARDRDDDNAPSGPDADMRPNDTDEQTGY